MTKKELMAIRPQLLEAAKIFGWKEFEEGDYHWDAEDEDIKTEPAGLSKNGNVLIHYCDLTESLARELIDIAHGLGLLPLKN